MLEGTPRMEPLLTFGPFTIDRRSLELRCEERVLRLQQQPTRVLLLLVERVGVLVTRDELRRAIWGEDVVVDFDRGLNFCISQIRCALAENADSSYQIETLRGRGYRFIGRVGSAPMPASSPSIGRPAPAWRWWLSSVIGIAVWMGFGGLSLTPRQSSPVTVGGTPPGPVRNRDGGSPSSRRDRAMARLAQSGSPHGAGSGTAAIRPRNVGSWLESRVDRSEDRPRVTVTLREADGSVRWTDAFDGQPEDWIDAQEEMSRIIARTLRNPVDEPLAGNGGRRTARVHGHVLSPRGEPYVQSSPGPGSASPSKGDTTDSPPPGGIHGSATAM